MKFSSRWLGSGIVAVFVILLSSNQPALADGYTVHDLGNDNGHGIYGIDTAGDVVIWGTSGCGVSSPNCYVTYVNGVATGDSAAPPILDYDNGASCSSSPLGFNTSKTVCNDGWIGFGSLSNRNSDPNGVYIGSGSSLYFLGSGYPDQVFLNSVGDFAWTDGQNDEMYVAIRNSPPHFESFGFSPKEDFVVVDTTPEPASLLLVGTGLVWVTILIWRRASRYSDLAE
jgi:hypothetical protein